MPSQPVSPSSYSGPRIPPPVRVALDLETTGLNAETDAIIEIGAVKFTGHRILDRFESLVAPNAPLPYRIQRLTGITPATLRRAPALSAVLTRLRAFVGEAPLVGHNVAFDAAFLRRVGLFARNPLIDTYELASMLLPTLASYSLASVGDALSLHRDESHRALADADLSRRVFLALAERLAALESGTIEDLLALPAGREWTPGFLLRQELRSRDSQSGSAFAGVLTASLGSQLASSLGVHPGALAMAGPSPVSVEPSPTSVASRKDVARRQAVASHMAPVLQSGGALLLEIEHDIDGLVACVEAALLSAAQSGERLVIAVADADALRRLTRDVVPLARAALNGSGSTLQIAEIAHRNAYLCLWRWFGVAREGDATPPAEVSRGLSKLVVWSRTTPTGMRADVALSGQEQFAWERVRAGREFVEPAAECPYGKGGYCFLSAAQTAARDAQVVLTTHAALAAQLAGRDDLLPDANRILILDAHLFEEALRDARSLTLERTQLRGLLATLAENGQHGRAGLLHAASVRLEGAADRAPWKQTSERAWFDQVAAARRCVERFFEALQTLIARTDTRNRSGGAAQPDTEQRVLLIDEDLRRAASWRHATAACHDVASHLTMVATTAREVAGHVQVAERKTPGSGSGIPLELLGIAAQLEMLAAGMTRIAGDTADGTSGIVSWLRVPYANQNDRNSQHTANNSSHAGQRTRGPRSSIATPTKADGEPPHADIASAPVGGQQRPAPGDIDSGIKGMSPEVESAVPPNSFAMREEVPVLHSAAVSVGKLIASLTNAERGLVLAGPSLSVAGDFEYMRGSLRLPESTAVASLIADREQQTLLCLPSDVPEPNAPRYQRSLEETLIQLATALDGRLVAVFPSHAALRSAYNGIRRALEAKNILVLGQGQDGSVRQLWQSFATEQRIVLLGAGAFWDGSMLRRHPPACVVVAKLPFPAMSDPLLAARAAQWDDAQQQFVVPQAALKLRQALAGLAWSHEKRNAVVLFDRRVQTRGYGSLVIGSLPRCSQHEEPVDALAERIAEWVGPA